MTFKKFFLLVLLSLALFHCKEDTFQVVEPQIIPDPLQQDLFEGQFLLDSKVGLIFNEEFKISGMVLKNMIEKDSFIKLKSVDSKRNILFVKDSLSNPEGYHLKVSEEEIVIKASTDAGAFYAVQTLRQLLPVGFENGTFQEPKVAIQCLTIKDEPRFAYRGMHLDVCRHFFPIEFVKKYIDALAMLKMNTFHWHLTEDQGWRIEIKKYPKLQEIAAFRNGTIVGHYPGTENDNQRHGGFYTQEEIKEVIDYAAKRHVTIIPEIELPGHSSAAIAAYSFLSCFPDKPTEIPNGMISSKSKASLFNGDIKLVQETWGVFDDIYCAGKDSTFVFLENVLDEVAALFPSEYIHIGGDEAPKKHWEQCPNCQKRMKDLGLKDEHELQGYFITRIEKHLNSKGKQIIGWDEILEGGLAPNATVMSWRGENGAIEASKQQHQVILTPNDFCYFDHYQSKSENEPLAIGGFTPLEEVYGYNPIPKEMHGKQASYVLGAQGNVWTEYITTPEQVEYMVFPRILAMSEIDWTVPENKNYQDFENRTENFFGRLKALNINYANHLTKKQD